MTKRHAVGAFVVLAALASTLPGCAKSTNAWQGRGGSPRIVVTIPALDNFVRNVAGKDASVICLCTDKGGPHHYEYNPQDAMALREADLFFAIGLTLDDKFADPMQVESHNARLRYIKLGERLPEKLKLKGEEHEDGKDEAKHEHAHGHDHEHGEFDPHVWLGIAQAKAMVEMIRDELKSVDAAHADDYDKNATAYLKSLDDLHTYGKNKLKNKKNRKLIAFHESLGYFAKSFDLNIVDAIEVTPGQEPSPNHLAELIKKAKDNHVHVLAVEPQYPKASADVVKKEVKNLKFAIVDPLETVAANEVTEDHKELKNKDWYEKKMRQNLDALAKELP
ncbi:MAG TPA: metal ABC transporter substrate-binding protein [Gemmataceae bacterium]|nr:metal ABC transporter substrate-binding protein [Gemmataceae bacterium]